MYSWRVPSATSAKIRFVAGQNIGELGTAESSPIIIQWLPFYNYPALSLWLLFILVLIIGLAHRKPGAWLILIPPVLIHLVWLLIKTIFDFSSSDGQMIAQIFIPLYISITLLFGLTHHISRQNRIASFFLALFVIIIVGHGSFFAYNFGGNGLSQMNRLALAFNPIMGIAFLIGLTTAIFLSRKRFTSFKFIAALFVFAFLFTVVSIFCFGIIDFGPSDLDDFAEILVVALMFGFLLCGVTLPFVILMFKSTYYRQALESYLIPQPKTQEPTCGESETKT